MEMKKNVFHIFRIPQDQQVSNSLRADVQRSIPNKAKLEKIENDFFIYSTGSGKKIQFFKVPIFTNEHGVRFLDYTKQKEVFKANKRGEVKREVLAMDGPAPQILKDVALLIFNTLTGKGESTMETVKPLLPPDIRQEQTMTAKDLQTMQDEADRMGILLPAEFNRSVASTKTKNQQTGEVEPLLPAGMN